VAFVEFWALPFVIAAVVAIRYKRFGLACAMTFSAAAIRELCVALLLGGIFAALRYRRAAWPWVVAIVAWLALFAWHVRELTPYLSASGSEPPLLRNGGLASVASMAGPYTFGFGLVVVVLAAWRTRGLPEWWLSIGLIVLIPAAGVFTSRFHWGILVFPTAVALLGSESKVFPRRPRELTASPPAPS
jgi:hypothetical protein